MSNKLIKPEAKQLFLDGKDAGDILKLFPMLSSSTLYAWIKKENWNELRDGKLKNYTKSPEIMLNMLDGLITKVDEMLVNPEITVEAKASAIAKLSDSISKIVKSIKSMSKEKDRLSSILFTLGEFGKSINSYPDKHKLDEAFRKTLDDYLAWFSQQMLDKYSPKNIG